MVYWMSKVNKQEYDFERFVPPPRRGWGCISSMKVGEIKILDEAYCKVSARLRAEIKKNPNSEFSIADAGQGRFAVRKDA